MQLSAQVSVLSSPKLLPLLGRCDVMHTEHAEDSQLKQHMLLVLLARGLVHQSPNSALPREQIVQVCYGSRQHLITVIQVHFGEQDACMSSGSHQLLHGH